jgi:hypothetical protein
MVSNAAQLEIHSSRERTFNSHFKTNFQLEAVRIFFLPPVTLNYIRTKHWQHLLWLDTFMRARALKNPWGQFNGALLTNKHPHLTPFHA